MVSKTEIIDALKNVMFPGLSKSLIDLDLVKDIKIVDDKNIEITFRVASLNFPGNEDIEAHSVVYLKDKLSSLLKLSH